MSTKPKTQYRLVDYPARLRAQQVGAILGFEDHEITVLVGRKLLKPLGKPVPNAQKYFAAQSILDLHHDVGWLEKATAAIYSYWGDRNRKPRNGNSQPLQLDPEGANTALAA